MRIFRFIGAVLLVILIFMGLRYSNIQRQFSLAALREKQQEFSHIVEQKYPQAVLFYIIIYAAVIMIAVPGFAPLTMIGGYLFGTIPGAIFALIGTIIGSLIAFFGIHVFLRGFVLTHYQTSLERFRHYINSYGIANTLILLHFLTVIPFFLINAFAAVAGIPIRTFIWTTIIGSLPLSFLYSFAGKQLHTINSVSDIFSPTIMILFGILILLALVPIIIRWMQED